MMTDYVRTGRRCSVVVAVTAKKEDSVIPSCLTLQRSRTARKNSFEFLFHITFYKQDFECVETQ
jgi:hypothetical protein